MKKHMQQFLLILLISLSTINGISQVFQKDIKAVKQINIETFTIIPNEIDGGSCNFFLNSNDEKESKYIFVNDFANLAFLKINGKLEKFTLLKYTESPQVYYYSNTNYKVIVKVKRKKSVSHEYSHNEGTINVKNTSCEKEITFIGGCGD